MTIQMPAQEDTWSSDMIHEEVLSRLANGPVHATTMQEQIMGMGVSRDLVASTVAAAIDEGAVTVDFVKSAMFLRRV